MQLDQNRLLKLTHIQELMPACKASIYNWVKRGILPPPIKIGRASYWKYSDIIAVIEKMGAAK
jgi:predicted DNA-binding transcriptional regulator AlpA